MPTPQEVERARLLQLIHGATATSAAAQAVHRLDCVLLVAEGRSCAEVAEWFGVDKRTIERWVHAAYAQGIDGLAEHPHGGRPKKLSAAEVQSIWAGLLMPPSACGYQDAEWTGKRLALHIEKCHAIKLSVRSCQRMIASCHGGAARAP
jgi:transposase